MSGLDSITVEVIHNYLLSAAREMERNLMRTSFNTIIYEIRDFGLGIYDASYRLLSEAPGLAVFTRGNDYGLEKSIEFLGVENVHPGDVILTSYPYWSSSHPLDVLAISPIFIGDELIGYTAIKQHWLDLAQKDPGYVLDSTDVFQEGLLLPAIKIYKRGELDPQILNLIRFNSRLPDRVIGDMNAQISACRTGERRVMEIAERFGVDTLRAAIEDILDHGERVARARMVNLPRGTWSAEDYVDDDGIDHATKLLLKCTVTITDDEFIVDWTGSNPRTTGPMNLPIGDTLGVSALAFKAITTPDIPANDGNFRPLRVIAPEGEMTHAVPPSPTFTLWASLHMPEVILKALSPVLSSIPACSGGDINSFIGVGVHPETNEAWLEATNEPVGFGAHAEADGEDAMMHLSEPGCRNIPIEVLETKAPMLIENYFIRQDSGGAGQHRGGCGGSRTYHFLDETNFLYVCKKTKTDPWGMRGGHDAESGHLLIHPGTADAERSGTTSRAMPAGTRVSNNAGGGGGWGDPMKRDPEKVRWDVLNEYVSITSAQDEYGVVIEPDTITVDESATAALRNS